MEQRMIECKQVAYIKDENTLYFRLKEELPQLDGEWNIKYTKEIEVTDINIHNATDYFPKKILELINNSKTIIYIQYQEDVFIAVNINYVGGTITHLHFFE